LVNNQGGEGGREGGRKKYPVAISISFTMFLPLKIVKGRKGGRRRKDGRKDGR
jgi:hypothetical protein